MSSRITSQKDTNDINTKNYLLNKKLANSAYKHGKFNEALRVYDLILSNYQKYNLSAQDISIIYNNKAMAHYYLKEYSLCVECSRLACENDGNNIKAYYYHGLSNYQLKKYQTSIDSYKIADKLSKINNYNVGDDICSLLRQAQREKFKQDEQTNLEKIDRVKCLLEKCKNLLLKNGSNVDDISVKCFKNDKMVDNIDNIQSPSNTKSINSDFQILDNLLNILESKNKRVPPPDALYGKISFELLSDPVITPSGTTYDRVNILEHLSRVGHFDPLTRQPLKVNDLIPNFALKELLDDFIVNNPWVEEDF